MESLQGLRRDKKEARTDGVDWDAVAGSMNRQVSGQLSNASFERLPCARLSGLILSCTRASKLTPYIDAITAMLRTAWRRTRSSRTGRARAKYPAEFSSQTENSSNIAARHVLAVGSHALLTSTSISPAIQLPLSIAASWTTGLDVEFNASEGHLLKCPLVVQAIVHLKVSRHSSICRCFQ